MLKTFTFVRRRPHLSREAFFDRWTRHTQEWDLRDHPKCTLNRLILLENSDTGFDAVAETHWPDEAALDEAIAFYGTEEGRLHWADLGSFMDIENSPTARFAQEAEVSVQKGITIVLE